MKVLMVSTSDRTGGAAIAAGRLMEALQKLDINVKMLVLHKTGRSEDVLSVGSTWRKRYAFIGERLVIWMNNLFSRKNLFKVSIANTGIDITQSTEFKEADVIHLHWINQGMLSLNGIQKIVDSGKPIVWTMHDMWECTGICHHAYRCTNFKEECGRCPFLRFPRRQDLSNSTFKKKKRLFNSGAIHFIAVSSWLASQAKSSALLAGKQVSVIPNTLALADFPLCDKKQSRERLKLPADKYVLIFGAARIDDPIKGLDLLLGAIKYLITTGSFKKEELHLLLFGNVKEREVLNTIPIDYLYMGSVAGSEALSQIYACGDVTVSSSYYETFGQTLIEAQACGCMPVAFDNSGQTDIIKHKENGYLADYLSVESLARGIEWALTEGREVSRAMLRKGVQDDFSGDAVARKQINLYTKLVGEKDADTHC